MERLKRILKRLLHIESPTTGMGLTKREKKLIFKIARQCGCDWDGDTLKFYVNEQQGVITPIKHN